MLGSISSVAEADILLNAGVDIIDIKDPVKGALGAVSNDITSDIVRFVDRRSDTSATIGDIEANSTDLLSRIQTTANTGVDFVKVGLFDQKIPSTFIKAIKQANKEKISIVVVLFAEFYSGWHSVSALVDNGIKGIMLDTCKKEGRSLLDILDSNELSDFVKHAKDSDLMTGLAGSLKKEDINELLLLNPDYLGFRGALCNDQHRTKAIDKERVIEIRQKLDGIIAHEYEVNYGAMA